MVTKISMKQTSAWLGSDIEKEALVYMINQIANGEYTPNQLKDDIEQYEE